MSVDRVQLVVGLGNPGAKYELTRHNIGFMVVDNLFSKLSEFSDSGNFQSGSFPFGDLGKAFSQIKKRSDWTLKDGALVSDFLVKIDLPGRSKSVHGKSESIKLILVKPQTFMNRSGEPVSKLANFMKVAYKDMLVLHDELDLKLGVVKIKLGGGEAGHNGLRSISQMAGTKEYVRIRLGIGRPEDSGQSDNKAKKLGEPNLGIDSPRIRETDISGWVLSNFSQAEKNLVEELISLGGVSVLEILSQGLVRAQAVINTATNSSLTKVSKT